MILQSETAKLSVTKSYILEDVVGVLQRGHKSDIMEFFITINCNNKNYYVSVSSLK